MPRRSGERRRGQPSLADVAARAGVSGQTVSRVVNGNANVLPQTRRKVERAMAELGYRANVAARALATGRFGSIGLVCFDLTTVGTLVIVDEAIKQAQERGYAVNLATVSAATDAGLQAAVRRLTDRAVDGLVVVEARILDTPDLRLPQDLPVVVAEGAPDVPYAAVGIDHDAGARLGVEHLLALGHATVHHIAGLPDSHPAVTRRAGWADTLRSHGLDAPEPIAGDWSSGSGYRAACELLRDESVTAVFVANDQMAAGVLRAAADLGRRVPDDLSVLGCDDAEVSRFLDPPLTTLRHDFRGVGRRCVELLIPAIGDSAPLPPTLDLHRPELVVRASTAPPRTQ